MRRASAASRAMGFSTRTCLPALAAATAMGMCVAFEVQTSTRSISSLATSFCQSVSVVCQPKRPAKACRLAASRPQAARITGRTGKSKKRVTLVKAWEWARPMNRAPTIATLMSLISLVSLVSSVKERLLEGKSQESRGVRDYHNIFACCLTSSSPAGLRTAAPACIMCTAAQAHPTRET